MNELSDDMSRVIDDTFEAEKRKRTVLGMLLDEVLRLDGTVVAQRARMAGSNSYVASVSLSWVRSHVRLASQMPLLKDYVDPSTGVLRVDEESLELLQQREVDWRRQNELAQYLLTNPVHKFPPLLLVMTAEWVDDPSHDAWDAEGYATMDSSAFAPLDNQGLLGKLTIDEEFAIYALDGQHRKIGIDGALELVSDGRLDVKRQNGSSTNETIILDELIEDFSLDPGLVQSLGSDTIGVEIIPAVIAGETRDEARRRVRAVFTHVNKQAASLTPGELAKLDEDDGFSIVARRVAGSHPVLASEDEGEERVNFKNATITARAEYFTTLQTLKEMTGRYLGADDHFSSWKARGRLLPVRPSDTDLREGRELFSIFMDQLGRLPSIERMRAGAPCSGLRRLSTDNPPGEANMLFRPVGQIALAQACGYAVVQGQALEGIFDRLSLFDEHGGFALDAPQNLWWGVLVRQGRIRNSGRETAVRLLIHLIAGLQNVDERESLTEELREARNMGDGVQYMGFTGEATTRDQIRLPNML